MEPISPPQVLPLNRIPDGVLSAQRMLQNAGMAADPSTPFNELLNRATSDAGISPQQQKEKQAEKVAGDLVSQALILPVLKQLRRGSITTNPVFGGGLGEKTFGPEFDIQIADRVAHSPQLGATKNIADRILHRKSSKTAINAEALGKKADLNG